MSTNDRPYEDKMVRPGEFTSINSQGPRQPRLPDASQGPRQPSQTAPSAPLPPVKKD